MATYVTSPPTQSGVANTRTSITNTFTLFAGYVEVEYEVSSESGFDFFRVYINGSLATFDSGVGGGIKSPQLSTSAGSQTIRLEYEKDGSDNDGTDNVTVYQIRIYSDDGLGGIVLEQTVDFSGTSGTGPPTGWTEILNDGATTVTGSHWTFTDTSSGVTGTIASTTTRPTFAATGNQTHVGTLATTTTRPTFAASGNQTHLGTLAATTTAPTAALAGNQTHQGVLGTTTTAPTFAGLGSTTSGVSATLAATTAAPTFAGAGIAYQPLPQGVSVELSATLGRVLVSRSESRVRVDADRGGFVRIQAELSTAHILEG